MSIARNPNRPLMIPREFLSWIPHLSSREILLLIFLFSEENFNFTYSELALLTDQKEQDIREAFDSLTHKKILNLDPRDGVSYMINTYWEAK